MQSKTEEILNSWEGAQRAQVTPFLHTRVMARIAAGRDARSGWIPSFLARPAVAIAMITAILALNGWLLFGQTTDTNGKSNDTEQTVSALINDYNLENTYSYTDINE